MQCYVYKGAKKPETYLYTTREDDFSAVPEALLVMMGELEHVLSLDLDEQRKLANADSVSVLKQLEIQGFYLQMPPDPDSMATA